ncbi:MAG: apolipoprotein N-acyltransferase [Acidobacteriota bacterium]|nr:apolipoprotein N-acyltransferase [Acidobacteriota bacterium]
MLLALSFPKFGHPAFAWIALTPLVVATARASRHAGSRPFFLGLLTGAVYFALTLYWRVETMTAFGGLAVPLAVLVAGVLVAYLALFPAAFALILARIHRGLGTRALLLAPAIWVATELGRQYVWDGFPWILLGYSQVSVLPVAQTASLVGVYGLSALLASTATAAAFVVLDRGRLRWVYAGSIAAVLAVAVLWGQARLNESRLLTRGQPVRVGVLQGNVAQEQKWDPALRGAITALYVDMTRRALGRGATFIMWPESSYPAFFEDDLVGASTVRQLARESGATLLIGSDQVEPVGSTTGISTPQTRLYNAAFLVKPDGTTGAVYRKMQLVPFGEYVPLKTLLFFVGPLVEAVSDFTPGRDPVLLPVGDHLVSTAICYEVIYPNLIRRFVRDGSELLTTITNDAWYGRSSAAYQHWDQAALRAIEQGRFLARAANTGISGFVDPYGRILEKTALFEPAIVVQDLRFLTDRTVYSRIGDAVAWLSLALTLAALLATRRLRDRISST